MREQHHELLRLRDAVVPLLDAERLVRSCTEVRLKLSAFARKLRVHLLLEVRFIYGRLLRHSDPAIVARAAQHQQEMHSLRDRIKDYAGQWISMEVAIQNEPSQFVEATKSILGLVSKRFELEDRDLYPLVDRILSPSGTWPIDLIAEAHETRSAG